jgi:hypothetical protein
MDCGAISPSVVAGLVGGLCGIFGTVVGALLTASLALGRSWIDRRWRRQDVRAAEKRLQRDDRLEPVRTYAIGLQEFVHESVGLMAVVARRARDVGWTRAAETVTGELDKRWGDAEALRPRPGPSYLLRNKEALESLLVLELEANGCRLKCAEHLDAAETMSEELAGGFVDGADRALDELLDRMERAVE